MREEQLRATERQEGAEPSEPWCGLLTHLGEADVVADPDPDLAIGGVHHRDGVAGAQRVRFSEGYLPRHIDVEEVDLAVLGQDRAVWGVCIRVRDGTPASEWERGDELHPTDSTITPIRSLVTGKLSDGRNGPKAGSFGLTPHCRSAMAPISYRAQR